MAPAPAPLPASGPADLVGAVLALGEAIAELQGAVPAGAAERRKALRTRARTGLLKPGRVNDPRPRAQAPAPPSTEPAAPAGWVPEFLLEGLEPTQEATP